MAVLLAILACSCNETEQADSDNDGIAVGAAGDNDRTAANEDKADLSKSGEQTELLDSVRIREIWEELSEMEQRMLSEDGATIMSWQMLARNREESWLREKIAENLERLRDFDWHEAAVPVGEARKWRSLDEFGGGYEDIASVLSGNFDVDPDWELLHVKQHVCSIMELDGSLRELPILGWDAAKMDLAWDWDGDGVMEMLSPGYGPEPPDADLQIVSLAGEIRHEFNGSLPIASGYTADIDGDGTPELLLYDKARKGIVAYGQGGREVWFSTVLAADIILAVGDFDGDGRDELLGRSLADQAVDGTGLLRAWSMGGVGVAIPGLHDSDQQEHPYYALDMDGDGRDEVVTDDTIVNPADGSRTKLELPDGWSSMDFGNFPAQLRACRTESGMQLAARLLQNRGSLRADTLIIWDADGRIVYLEHFAEALDGLLAVRQGSVDRLVIMKADGIYVEQ